MANFKDILSEATISEEAKVAIQNAWDQQITEAKQALAANLREEFAQKFEHDKSVLVESMDNFLRDKIAAEIAEFATDKKALIAEQVRYKTQMKEHVKMLNTFIAKQLRDEMVDLKADKKQMKENMEQLESFLIDKLSEEIQEFRKDKQALVEQRVKLVAQGKKHLEESKRKFITSAASLVESKINSVLRNEIGQYREDIISARENDFGRRIFEAFAGEYMTSYLNEGSEVMKIRKQLEESQVQNKQLQETVKEKEKLAESVKTQLKVAKDLSVRNNVMNELCAPLGKDKRKVMEELLETVQTQNLKESFKKYLPAVLNESAPRYKTENVLKESVVTEKTGDRTQKSIAQNGDQTLAVQLDEIKKLAGINTK